MSEVVDMSEEEHQHFHTFMTPTEEYSDFGGFSQKFDLSQSKEHRSD
jgi:hypothetical protein